MPSTTMVGGQTSYFEQGYPVVGGVSFDYNCSGAEEEEPNVTKGVADGSGLAVCENKSGALPGDRKGSAIDAYCGSTMLVKCTSSFLACAPTKSSDGAPIRCR